MLVVYINCIFIQFVFSNTLEFQSFVYKSNWITEWVTFCHVAQWTGSIASTKKLSPIWDPVHLQTYSFLVWKPLKNKYFIFVLFRNWPISTFPYVKLEAKWRKNGSLCSVNCLILIKTALNSLLNKHWHEPKPLRIQSCSFQWKYVSKIGFILQFFVII